MNDTTSSDVMQGMKTCLGCLESKPFSAYGKHSGGRLGLQPRCKGCRSIDAAARRLGLVERRTSCVDCGTDITHRDTRAKLCEGCKVERNKASAMRYYQADPVGVRQRIQDRWFAKPHEERLAKSRAQMLKGHGITQEIYDAWYETQMGVCKTCKKPETHKYKGVVTQLCVDHDHNHCPGKKGCAECVRGLLCHDCNAGLGYFDDDIETMLAAVEYLRSWELEKARRVI